MLSVKKATKFAVANLIIVSTVFSWSHLQLRNPIKVLKDANFRGLVDEKSKKCYLFSWRWHGSII